MCALFATRAWSITAFFISKALLVEGPSACNSELAEGPSTFNSVMVEGRRRRSIKQQQLAQILRRHLPLSY